MAEYYYHKDCGHELEDDTEHGVLYCEKCNVEYHYSWANKVEVLKEVADTTIIYGAEYIDE